MVVFNGSSMDTEDASWYDDRLVAGFPTSDRPNAMNVSGNSISHVDHHVADHAYSNNINGTHSSGYSSNQLQQNTSNPFRQLVRLNSVQAVNRYIEGVGDEDRP